MGGGQEFFVDFGGKIGIVGIALVCWFRNCKNFSKIPMATLLWGGFRNFLSILGVKLVSLESPCWAGSGTVKIFPKFQC